MTSKYLCRVLGVSGCLLAAFLAVFADAPAPELSKLLPANPGQFHQSQPTVTPSRLEKEDGLLKPEMLSPPVGASEAPLLSGEAVYVTPKGQRLTVEVVKTIGDSDAYAILTQIARALRESGAAPAWSAPDFSSAMVQWSKGIAFVRGPVLLRVRNLDGKQVDANEMVALARLLAEPLDRGEGEVPVLLKHLPDWQTAQANAVYVVNSGGLTAAIKDQPILNEISFEGGAEAVVATYGKAQLVVTEFTTPQLAGDSDRRISAKIPELKNQGQSSPTAYRRVGNYSVFVFNADNEAAANQLIDQVKYEQVVQWLGDNPHWYERAVREWAKQSADVVVTVLETSGLSLLLCVGVGALLGVMVFRYRRARQRQAAVYSDAGGMVRLELDEITITRERPPR